MTREENILHERGPYWVYRERNAYTVYKDWGTCAKSDSSYAKTKDGLSLAMARCDYLGLQEISRGQSELCRAYARNISHPF